MMYAGQIGYGSGEAALQLREFTPWFGRWVSDLQPTCAAK